MKFKIKHNIKEFRKEFDRFTEKLNETVMNGLDKPAKESIKSLKTNLRGKLRNVEDRTTEQGKRINPNPDKPDLPRYKKDLIKHVFNKDYSQLEMVRRPDKNTFPTNFGSGVYLTLNGRFEVDVPMQHGLTANDYKQKVKDSLKEAIIVDPQTGQAYQVDPDFVDGMKLKCSNKDRSDDERLDDLINNGATNITVTAYKDNFQRALGKAIRVDPIVDAIMDGEDSKAQDMLKRHTTSPKAREAIERIEDLKNGETEDVKPDVVALNNSIKLINNLRIKKNTKASSVTYSLVSSYQNNGEQFEALENELSSQLGLWLVGVQEDLVHELVQQITKIIEDFGRTG
jgi:hypothetical protein